MFRRINFQDKLKTYLVVLFSLSLLVSVTYYYHSEYVLKRMIRGRMINTLVTVGREQVDLFVKNKQKIFNDLYSELIKVEKFEHEEVRGCLKEWEGCIRYHDCYRIAMIRADGMIFSPNYKSSDYERCDMREQKWYREAVGKHGQAVWSFCNEIQSNNPRVALSRAVFDREGAFVGVFSITTNLYQFLPCIFLLDSFPEVSACVVDDEGAVISLTQPWSGLETLNSDKQFRHILADMKGGRHLDDGVNHFIGTSPVNGVNWKVAVLIPNKVLTEQTGVISSVVIYYIIVLFLLYFVMAAFIIRRFSRDRGRVLELCQSVVGNEKKLAEKIAAMEDDEYKDIYLKFVDLANHCSNAKTKSLSDPLTGIYNRTFLEETIDFFIESHKPFALMIFDIDDFKSINDNHGHLAGDDALRRIAKTVRASIRHDEDVFARYGGDEFAVVFNTDSPKELKSYSVRLQHVLNTISESGISVTISGGIAIYKKGMRRKDIIYASDSLLYKAKQYGKNSILVGCADDEYFLRLSSRKPKLHGHL